MICWAAEAPEVGPETGYSSIGGMLPYWVPPQGVFWDLPPPFSSANLSTEKLIASSTESSYFVDKLRYLRCRSPISRA